MRRMMGHKWAIGVSALALVFALGAISWAATENAAAVDQAADPLVEASGPGFGMLGPDGIVPEGDFAAFGRMGRHGQRGGALTDEMKAQIEERRAQMEARRDAFHDLIREKMSSEDQAAFDSLLATAETQRDELEKAQEALRGTTSDIRDLVGEYFPLGETTDGVATGTTNSTGTTSSGL